MPRTQFGGFGVPLRPLQRQIHAQNGPVVRPRARQPYTRVTPTFGPTRTQFEMDMNVAHRRGGVTFGIPDGGMDLGDLDRSGRPRFAGTSQPTANRASGLNAGPAAEKADANLRALEQLAPAAGSLLAQLLVDDPRTDFRVYQARVENLRRTIASVPPFLRPYFEQRLNIVEAKLQAARERRALEIEAERATRTWRFMGWTFSATGIAVGASLVVLLLAGARTARSHERRESR